MFATPMHLPPRDFSTERLQCRWQRLPPHADALGLAGEWLDTLSVGRAGLHRDHRGRPRLPPGGGDIGWSHSAGRLLMAFAPQGRVGVDLEASARTSRALTIARRYFTPEEADALATLDAASRQQAFLRLWCAKEGGEGTGRASCGGCHRMPSMCPAGRTDDPLRSRAGVSKPGRSTDRAEPGFIAVLHRTLNAVPRDARGFAQRHFEPRRRTPPSGRLRQTYMPTWTNLRPELDPACRPCLETSLADPLLAYLALLARWNRTYNLTAIRDPGEMLSKHLLDSLAMHPHLDGVQRLADLGTGAGLPGIPLAIALPGLRVTLVESNGKKARFLREAVRTCNWPTPRWPRPASRPMKRPAGSTRSPRAPWPPCPSSSNLAATCWRRTGACWR